MRPSIREEGKVSTIPSGKNGITHMAGWKITMFLKEVHLQRVPFPWLCGYVSLPECNSSLSMTSLFQGKSMAQRKKSLMPSCIQ